VLEESGYVSIEKAFEGKRPRTWLAITKAGKHALTEEVEPLRRLLHELDGGASAGVDSDGAAGWAAALPTDTRRR